MQEKHWSFCHFAFLGAWDIYPAPQNAEWPQDQPFSYTYKDVFSEAQGCGLMSSRDSME
jgi:hypothetical protein